MPWCAALVLRQECGGLSFNPLKGGEPRKARPVDALGNANCRLATATESPFAALERQAELGSPAGSSSCHVPTLPQRPDKANNRVMLTSVVTMSRMGLLHRLRQLDGTLRRLLLRASAQLGMASELVAVCPFRVAIRSGCVRSETAEHAWKIASG